MFRIRRVYDTVLPVNRTAIAQVQDIIRLRFPAVPEQDIAKIPEQLQNPLKYRFRPTLLVQEGGYNTRNLGVNARHFLKGIWNGMYENRQNYATQ